MKTTLFMATSINGFVARPDGDEDFLSNENWMQLLDYATKYKHVIWGRKTYEAVRSWGEGYMNDLENVHIVVVSKSEKCFSEKNVTMCNSPQEAMKIVRDRNYKKALLSGGPKLNSSFAKAGLIDEILINYNPVAVGNGMDLFDKSDFEMKLKLKDVNRFASGIVQLCYSVI